MSSIQATEESTTEFLALLETISAEQKMICSLLDELIQLMQMPSEPVLKILAGLLSPMQMQVIAMNNSLAAIMED